MELVQAPDISSGLFGRSMTPARQNPRSAFVRALSIFLLSLCTAASVLTQEAAAQPGSTEVAAEQPVLTLEEAIRMAQQNNYAIRIAQNDVRIAENDYSIGNAGFLPSLGLNARQSRQSFGNVSGDRATFGTANTVDLSMELSTTIFDGGGRFATYRRLGSQREFVERAAERTTESLLADVVVAYYDLTRQQQQLEVLEEAVEISEERQRIAELRRDLGSASELEVRRAQVDLNADRAGLLRQRVALANAKAAFNQMLAREGGLDFVVSDSIEVDRSLAFEQIRAEALRRNKALGVASQARETAELAKSEVRADRLPTVGLSAGYAFNDFTSELGLPAGRPPGLNYGITASWGIFDGFNRRRRLQNADLAVRNSQLAVEDTRTEVVTRLETAHQNYSNSLELVDLERENVALAGFNVEVALEQFRVGTITSVELREVQSAFTSAELRYITAQFEAARAQTNLLQLSGTLLERLAGE